MNIPSRLQLGTRGIGGASLRAALIAGSRDVIACRDELNRINVFPVADGDTGTNLAFTFAAVLSGAEGARGGNAATVLRQAALNAIDGARGNSGAILAQFFYGLSEAINDRARVTLAELSAAVSHAACAARKALADPREGTVLSVIADFAEDLGHQQQAGQRNLQAFFAHGLACARASLARTPKQLAVLADHHVVDAGGSGFVAFLEGVQRFVELGRSALHAASAQHNEPPRDSVMLASIAHEEAVGPYRFCSECLLSGPALDLAALRQALAELPHDSQVLAGGAERARLHAHTDDPAMLFELAGRFGQVSGRKAEDMHAQVRARRSTVPVAVLCDSGADLPSAEIERLNIHTVPVRVNFGNEEFLDRITLSTQQFYQRLRKESQGVRTSQPPAGEFRRLFDTLASHHEGILCLNVSSRLSGTWQAACSAAQHGGSGKVRVVDTLNAATGEALVVLDAAEAAQAGWRMPELVARAESMRARTTTYALIHDLAYGIRGGRLPAWLGPLARWLRVKVLIADNGAGLIKPVSVLWGERNVPERFAAWVLGKYQPTEALRILVGHCDARDEGRRLQDWLKARVRNLTACELIETGTGIGAHAGPGSLVLGVQRSLPL